MRKSLGIAVLAIVAIVLVSIPAIAGGKGHPMLMEMNETLAAMGENVRIEYAEFIVTKEAPDFGGIIYSNYRGNKQLSSDWVPYDPNRWGVRDIFWATDQIDQTSWVPWMEADAAIDRAMQTWQNVQCSAIPLTKVDDYGLDLGYVQWLAGLGGVPGWLADFTQAGWLPSGFFDLISEDGNGGAYILGATFTFVWIDTATGENTDMDGNGKDDVAFKEVYYNDDFSWAIDADRYHYDIETVVLHEAGHGLSQAHFGKIFIGKNGKVHFAPRAVMNALYTGVQQELTGTDVGGHCSNWGSWPNN